MIGTGAGFDAQTGDSERAAGVTGLRSTRYRGGANGVSGRIGSDRDV